MGKNPPPQPSKPKEEGDWVNCPAGCGYQVLITQYGKPHKILVDDNWITCPGG